MYGGRIAVVEMVHRRKIVVEMVQMWSIDRFALNMKRLHKRVGIARINLFIYVSEIGYRFSIL